ncbi:hypothetical protein Taro_006364 [Colocasia esculenta]|uniref:Uncharacterized protein n=1 Tax=Colocasia esculenta TaxID=4460 RepID=A0A843TWT7_COLES|nr:hypothetical protein [Colocasia esculenta]
MPTEQSKVHNDAQHARPSTQPTQHTPQQQGDSQQGKDTFNQLRRLQPCTGEGHTTQPNAHLIALYTDRPAAY